MECSFCIVISFGVIERCELLRFVERKFEVEGEF